MRSLRSSTLLDLETTPQRRELLGDWMQWFSPGLDAVVFLRIVVFSYFGSSGVSGAIPSTFAALRNLQTVWASDNELTGSIPEFIGNWSKLKSLILRNNNISGSIPSNIGDNQRLSQLDFSFNKLAGQIPDSLFNWSSLLLVEESKFVFEAKTIQRMELLVLSTLQWKMNPVTPLSFVDHIVRRFGFRADLHLEFM
ncbi:unnamed protein product [Camellia sinensis]